VAVLVREGPGEVEQMIEWGMRVDRDADGSVSLGREGGHRQDRIVHADGDATGAALAAALIARVRALGSVRLFDRCFALDVLTRDDAGERRAAGVLTWHPRFGLQIVWARATVLASGGAGQVYRETTNPKVTTGDGIAMALRAGAELSDLEFFQFHPTALYVAGAGRMLISEAVRGEGAHLAVCVPAIEQPAALVPFFRKAGLVELRCDNDGTEPLRHHDRLVVAGHCRRPDRGGVHPPVATGYANAFHRQSVAAIFNVAFRRALIG
jgi:hypothetical protein